MMTFEEFIKDNDDEENYITESDFNGLTPIEIYKLGWDNCVKCMSEYQKYLSNNI